MFKMQLQGSGAWLALTRYILLDYARFLLKAHAGIAGGSVQAGASDKPRPLPQGSTTGLRCLKHFSGNAPIMEIHLLLKVLFQEVNWLQEQSAIFCLKLFFPPPSTSLQFTIAHLFCRANVLVCNRDPYCKVQVMWLEMGLSRQRQAQRCPSKQHLYSEHTGTKIHPGFSLFKLPFVIFIKTCHGAFPETSHHPKGMLSTPNLIAQRAKDFTV